MSKFYSWLTFVVPFFLPNVAFHRPPEEKLATALAQLAHSLSSHIGFAPHYEV